MVNFKVDKNQVTNPFMEYIKKTVKALKLRLEEEEIKNVKFTLSFFNAKQGNNLKIEVYNKRENELKHFFQYKNTELDKYDEFRSQNLKLSENQLNRYIFDVNYYSEENVFKFIKSVVNGDEDYGNFTAPPPKIDHISNPVCGDTFQKEILDSKRNEVLFVYSHTCHGCHKFLPFYE